MSEPTRVERLRSLQEYSILKQSGDLKARRLRDRIALENDKLAISIARRMLGVCSESLDDLTQLARIGLLKAIERFDPGKGAAFSSFAVPYIRGEILHYLRDHWRLLKIPRRWLETLEKVERIERKLEAKGRKVEAWRIAEAIGVPRQRWQEIEEAFKVKPLVPLDEVLHLSAEETDERRELRDFAIRHAATLPDSMRSLVIEFLFGQLKEEALAKQHDLDLKQVRLLIQQGLYRLRSGKFEDVEA